MKSSLFSSSVQWAEWVLGVVERAAVYRLLGRLWVAEVDADLLAALRSDSFGGGLQQLLREIDDGDAVDGSSVLETLAIDYCRLFIGPREHFPPVQSVWLESHFEGDSTVSARGYQGLIETVSGYRDDCPPDHLGNLLLTMAAFLDALAVAVEPFLIDDLSVDDLRAELDRGELRGLSEVISGCFLGHLCWMGPFFSQVCESASTQFYRGLAELTSDFLDSDFAVFSLAMKRDSSEGSTDQ